MSADWRRDLRKFRETRHIDIEAIAKSWQKEGKLHGTPVKMNLLELKNLLTWFDKVARSKGVEDPSSIAIEDYIDPSLTYQENKQIVASEVLHLSELPEVPELKDMENEAVYEAKYKEYLDALEEDVKLNMPEVYDIFQERLKTLKEEVEKAQGEAISAEAKIQRYAERQRELKGQLEQTRKILEENRSRPPAYQPINFKVIQPFSEGIVEYRAGQTYSTTDLQWVIDKMKEKLIEAETIRKLVKPLEAPTPTPTTPMPPTDKPATTELLAVWIKNDLPAFIGSDMRKYGPFKAGDVAVLTKHDAEYLLKANVVSTKVEEAPKPKEEKPKFELPSEKIEQLWEQFTLYLRAELGMERVNQFREEFDRTVRKAKSEEEAIELIEKLNARIKAKGEAPATTFRVTAPFAVPFQTTNKNAKIIKNDLLRGKKIYPMVFTGGRARFKTIGYLKVDVRNPATGQYLGAESIKVEFIANMPWKEATERFELWKELGVDWQCVEAPFNSMKLIRCIADNPMTGVFYEKFFLAPKGSEGTVVA